MMQISMMIWYHEELILVMLRNLQKFVLVLVMVLDGVSFGKQFFPEEALSSYYPNSFIRGVGCDLILRYLVSHIILLLTKKLPCKAIIVTYCCSLLVINDLFVGGLYLLYFFAEPCTLVWWFFLEVYLNV